MNPGTELSHERPGAGKPPARLKKRAEFLRVARGTKAAMPGLVLQALRQPDPQAPLRAGYTVTRKVGCAVVRNRARRRLRALARALLPDAGRPGYDYVLVGRAATLSRSFDALLGDLHAALARVHQEREYGNR